MAYWTVLGTSTIDPPKGFGLNLDTDTKKWMVGGVSHGQFFKTKSGTYVIKPAPDLGLTLLSADGSSVAFFRNLHNGTAVGGTGNGNQFETAVTFSWKLDSK
jgi:hypothetical protein